MPSIQLLDESIARKIAAGEVVERPFSVVKELAENSIDAGSTFITVDIIDGGIKQIRVTDNGCGIPSGEVKLAFARHATSKLTCAEDLFNITQMGFRGEALYSVAAVAKVEMTTKPAAQQNGVSITVKGGKIENWGEFGCPDGTEILVTDLFYNTPARLKFLHTPTNEAAAVSTVLSRLILCNPAVSFKFISNNRVVYHSPGDGKLMSAIYAVYGANVVQHLTESSLNSGEYGVSGYIGDSETGRSSRYHQILSVNGRPIQHPAFTRIIEDAYGKNLPPKRYPAFFLNLKVPPSRVDVNVHPNKLQVRFSEEQILHTLIFSAVSRAISRLYNAPVALMEDEPVPEPPIQPLAYNRVPVAMDRNERTFTHSEKIDIAEKKPFIPTKSAIPSSGMNPLIHPESSAALSKPTAEQAVGSFARNLEQDLGYKLRPEEPNLRLQQTQTVEMPPPPVQQDMPEAMNPVVIGQAYDAYIIVQTPEAIFLIDQHAAHERLLYDRYSLQLASSVHSSQALLVPIGLDVTYEEHSVIETNLPIFHELGFELEEYGRLGYQIRTVPFLLGQPQGKELLRDMLGALMEDSVPKNEDLKKEKLMSMACRKAVKAGDRLGNEQLRALLDIIEKEKTPLTCPHGRPFVLSLEKRTIDRHFKRT